MFTGIVQAVGQVRQHESRGEDLRLGIAVGGALAEGLCIGDSVAVNGVCLTAVEIGDGGFAADVSNETIRHTALAGLRIGSLVNLEPALTLSTPLGGHLVSGHVDGVGEVVSIAEDGRSWRFGFMVPDALARYVARKGSICIDGVSLTVNGVDGNAFDVNVVPHTMSHTIIGEYRSGTRVNIEVDLVARYLERLLQGGDRHGGDGNG
jgi:riboflavin synthase